MHILKQNVVPYYIDMIGICQKIKVKFFIVILKAMIICIIVDLIESIVSHLGDNPLGMPVMGYID